MRVEPSRSSWVRISCPRPAARVRLICLPFAGGSANSYLSILRLVTQQLAWLFAAKLGSG